MKLIWNVMAILSFANLMAIGGLAGWLLNSDRLDADRADRIRAMLAEPISVEQARLAEEAAEAAAAEAERQEMARLSAPSVSSNEAALIRLASTEVDQQRVERLRREVDDLKASLREQRRVIDEDRAQLEADKAAFEAMQEEIRIAEGDEQFQKSLGTIQSMKPTSAADLLSELINDNARAQAVSYLDAMKARTRTKVMEEMARRDPVLATGLLEDLRLRGVVPSGG